MDRCTELHVEEGSAFSRLKEGQSVRNRHGQIVHPHQVSSNPACMLLTQIYGLMLASKLTIGGSSILTQVSSNPLVCY